MDKGLHEDVSFTDYCSWKAINHSRLKLFKQSPAHYQYSIDSQKEPTEALILGNAAHCAVLEPDKYNQRYVLGIEGDGRKTEIKEARAQLEIDAKERGQMVITREEHETACSIAKAVHSHSKVMSYFDGAKKELSAFAHDKEVNNIATKARMDVYNPRLKALIDLKTSANAAPWNFARSIFSYHYYTQGAFYKRILENLGLEVRHFLFVVVEKEPPHGIKIYRLIDEVLDLGNKEVDSLLRLYATCLDRQEYPSYSDDVEDIGLPAYAFNQLEDQYGTGPRLY